MEKAIPCSTLTCGDWPLSPAKGLDCPKHGTEKCLDHGVFESEHPYDNYLNQKWSLDALTNGKSWKVYFESFETERDDDYLKITAEGITYKFTGYGVFRSSRAKRSHGYSSYSGYYDYGYDNYESDSEYEADAANFEPGA